MESKPLIAETELSEHRIQHNCFMWHWNTFTEYRRLLFHVNNKAKNRIEGAKMRSLGVVASVPDFIYMFGNCFGIEMKTETGIVSKDQKELHQHWALNGTKVYVCRSLEQFKSIIEEIHVKG